MSDTEPRVGAVTRFNLAFARRATIIFGTMWCFYAFVIYGALGAIFPKYQAGLLYWSNWCQLWSLPLLMVGAYVLGRDTEKRQLETHDAVIESRDTVKEEIGLVRDDHAATARLVASLSDLVTELHGHVVGAGAESA